jgi:replicative superfamily II helicase
MKFVKKLQRTNNLSIKDDPNYLFTCTYEMIEKNLGCLIFCSSKKLCEIYAYKISDLIKKIQFKFDESLIQKRIELFSKLKRFTSNLFYKDHPPLIKISKI